MKQTAKKLINVIILVFGLSSLQAQEAIPATGGEATGSEGSATYTVGQVFYTTNTGANGNSITQGVQQPFEISVVTGIPEAKGISLNISAYPNPTTNYLTLKVNNYNTANLQYMILDIKGNLLQQVKSTGSETRINIQDYPAANYFVKALDKNRQIKVFKIVKN